MSDSAYGSDDASHASSEASISQTNNENENNNGPDPQQITASLQRMSKLVSNLLSRSDALPFREPVDWKALKLYDYPKIIKKMMDLGTIKKKLDQGKYRDALECAEDVRLVWRNCQTYNADGSDFYFLAETLSKRFEERFEKIIEEFGEDVVCGNALEDDDDGGNNGGGGTRNSQERRVRSNSVASSGRTTPIPLGGETNANNNNNDPSSGSKSDRASFSAGQSFSSTGNNNNNSSSNDNNTKEIIPLDIRTRFAARLQRLSGMELGHVLQIIDTRCPEALEDPSEESLPSGAPYPVKKPHNYSWDAFDGGCQIEIDVDVIPADLFYELDKYVKEKVQGRGRGAWSDEIWSDLYSSGNGSGADGGGGGRGSFRGRKRKHKSF